MKFTDPALRVTDLTLGHIFPTETLYGPTGGVSFETVMAALRSLVADGKDGNTVLGGLVPPDLAVGRVGDFYIDTAAGILYGPKTISRWPLGTVLSAQKDSGIPAGLDSRIGTLETSVAALSYVPTAITSFTVDGSTQRVVEVGQSIASVTLAWALNKTVASQTITGASTASPPPGVTTFTVAGLHTTNKTWHLTVDDNSGRAGASATASASLAFRHKRYWGASANQTLTSAQILALGGSEFGTAFGKSVTYDCTGGKYPFYAYPASFGTPDAVTVGGLAFSDFAVTDQPFVNASGATEPFRVLRFNTIQNGSAIAVVWA